MIRRHGRAAEVLEIEAFEPRPPGEGEVLLRIAASPVNPADLNMIEGTYGTQPPLPPTEATTRVTRTRTRRSCVDMARSGLRVRYLLC